MAEADGIDEALLTSDADAHMPIPEAFAPAQADGIDEAPLPSSDADAHMPIPEAFAPAQAIAEQQGPDPQHCQAEYRCSIQILDRMSEQRNPDAHMAIPEAFAPAQSITEQQGPDQQRVKAEDRCSIQILHRISEQQEDAHMPILEAFAHAQSITEQQVPDKQRVKAEDRCSIQILHRITEQQEVEGEDCEVLEERLPFAVVEDGADGRCCLGRETDNGEEGRDADAGQVREEFECRICQQAADLDALWAPCRCTGTMRYVHPACLQAWRQRGSQDAVRCGVCLATYEGARELSWYGAGPTYIVTRLRETFSSIREPPAMRRGLRLALRMLAGLAVGKGALCRALRLAFWSMLLLLSAACSRPVLMSVSAFHELVMGVDRAVDPIIFPEQPLDALYRFFPAIGGFGHLGVYDATASLAEALAAVAFSGSWVTCSAMDGPVSGAAVAAADDGSSSCPESVATNSSAASSFIAAMVGNATSAAGEGISAINGSMGAAADSIADRMACNLAANASDDSATGGTTLENAADAAAAAVAALAQFSISDFRKVTAEAAAPWVRPFQEVIGQALARREAIWRMPTTFDEAALGLFLLVLSVHLVFCVFPEIVTDALRRIPSPIEDAMALLQGGVPGPDDAVAFILLSLPWASYSARWLLAGVGILPMENLPFNEHAALHILLGVIVIAMYSFACDTCDAVHQDFCVWYAEFTLGPHHHIAGQQLRPDDERLGMPPHGM